MHRDDSTQVSGVVGGGLATLASTRTRHTLIVKLYGDSWGPGTDWYIPKTGIRVLVPAHAKPMDSFVIVTEEKISGGIQVVSALLNGRDI